MFLYHFIQFKYDGDMDVFRQIEDFPEKDKHAALTIGNFDGIHLGHQSVLHRLKEVATNNQAESIVMTFSNHPSTILRPESPTPLLTTTEQKLELLEKMGIDVVILLEFTQEFSKQTAQEFLGKLGKSMNLKFLVLGHDSTLGKDRKGDEEIVRDFAKSRGFSVEYLDELRVRGQPVSSSEIRHCIEEGNFSNAAALLGRKYSLKLPVQPGKGLGKQIGFSTANFNVRGLTIPPLGVYSVWLKISGSSYESVANLGFAPTVKGTSYPELEVHVIEQNVDLSDREVEIIFHLFIREEKKFKNIEELKNQISLDIKTAKSQLKHDCDRVR